MMRRLLVTLAALALAALLPAQQALAAPVSPGISIMVRPREVMPGQAGFISITGGYPLEVSASLDGRELPVYWAGKGYIAPFAFGHDAGPGSYGLVVTAANPLTGERMVKTDSIRVLDIGYPLEEISVSSRLTALLDPALNQSEANSMAAIFAPDTRPNRWDWPFDLPAPGAAITSQYGANRTYNNGLLDSYHTGTDFRRFTGDPVMAAAGGRVAAAQSFAVRGNAVIIDHGYGVYSLYGHLSEIRVQPGQYVARGAVIGLAGSTGRSAGPHLHFEIVVNGDPVDSVQWLALGPGFVAPPEVLENLQDMGE